MIYNEWFRDENLEAPLMLGYKKTDEGTPDTDPAAIANQTANDPKQTPIVTGKQIGRAHV